MSTKGFAARYVAAGLAPIAAVIAISASMAANAEVLYSDPLGDGWGRTTYNNGAYTRLDDDDLGASSIHDSTIRDNVGNTYDCDSLGYCRSRW